MKKILVFVCLFAAFSFANAQKKSNNVSNTDSLQTKEGMNAAGSHTNPYYKSNELDGEMVGLSNPNGNGLDKKDLKRLIEIRDTTQISKHKYIFFKDGKAYYLNMSSKKLEGLFNNTKSEKDLRKVTTCPPHSNIDGECKLFNGFCFYKLKS